MIYAANCFFNVVLKPIHGGHHSLKRSSSVIGQPAEMNKRATDYLIAGLSQVEGWLCPTTAHIMITLAEEQTRLGMQGDLAEIGVHHGKSFLALATSIAPGKTIFAIDVFEDQHRNVDQSGRGDRQIFSIASMRMHREQRQKYFRNLVWIRRQEAGRKVMPTASVLLNRWLPYAGSDLE